MGFQKIDFYQFEKDDLNTAACCRFNPAEAEEGFILEKSEV
jgi:hypothetical protein